MQIICDNHKLKQLQIKQNTFVISISGIYLQKLLLVAPTFTRAAGSTFAVRTRGSLCRRPTQHVRNVLPCNQIPLRSPPLPMVSSARAHFSICPEYLSPVSISFILQDLIKTPTLRRHHPSLLVALLSPLQPRGVMRIR